MTRIQDLPVYDYDPETGEVPTEASRAKIVEGFAKLIDGLQRPLNEAQERETERLHQQSVELNAKLAIRDGFFTPEGCSIPVSPSLIKSLEPSRRDQV